MRIPSTLAILLLASAATAQTTVTYQADAADILNPERGFYHQAETYSNNYVALDPGVLTNWREVDHHSLLLRLFYLQDFVNAPISEAYLSAMQDDMEVLRTAGMKAIVRFAYTSNSTAPYGDADKPRVLQHIAQLEPVLRAHSDVIAFVQAGFIGTWGEWYYTDHFGFPPTESDWQDRQDVVEALLAALPDGIMVQLRTPAIKQRFYGTTPLAPNDAFTASYQARTGHHNDCFLAGPTDAGTYVDPAAEYPYLHAETEFTPMGGETCAPDPPRSECATALEEMAYFHWSYLHTDWNPDVINGFATGGCLPEIKQRLGYRFTMVDATLPTSALAGGTLDIALRVTNSGFTVPYKQHPAHLVLRQVGTNTETLFPLEWDVREWDADNTLDLQASVDLPAGMPMGDHDLFLWLPDSAAALMNDPRYAIRMANTGTWEPNTGYNDLLHTVTLSGSVGISASSHADRWRVTSDEAGHIRFPGGLHASGMLDLIDAQGRVVANARLTTGTAEWAPAAVAPGLYHVVWSDGMARRSMRVRL
ncbi:MAG: DUF4832 domain-containing protein [Flavobacteriales bacterium]|nr:DUF4832 domain-containing protein [Flavobacteriales bacterium]